MGLTKRTQTIAHGFNHGEGKGTSNSFGNRFNGFVPAPTSSEQSG